MSGDLAAVQPELTGWQGQREFKAANEGEVRYEDFVVELKGADDPLLPPYAPNRNAESVVKSLVTCKFAVAFTEPPLLRVDINLKWRGQDNPNIEANKPQTRDPEKDEDDYEPIITACVMSWKRLSEHFLFVGAVTSIRVYDHPWKFKMFARLSFCGPALAVPLLQYDPNDVIDTTKRI